MKNKIFLILTMILALSCVLVISANADTIDYSDAPARTNIQVLEEDVIVFDDGFSCLTGYVFKDQSTVNGGRAGDMQYALDFTYINTKTGKTYTFANVVEMDIPQGVTYLGDRLFQDVKTIKKVSVPNTVTGFGVAFCQGASNLEECVFEHDANSNLTSFPTYIFYNTALKAFSMPDCITKIAGEAHFTSCDNLQAVHLSEKLTTWESGGGGRRVATFDDCYNVFFVNETFTTSDTAPAKPTIYYFPANLETMSNECIFRECQSLNDVLVFGKKFTTAPNQYLFQNGPANKIVFLGDMTTVATQYWGKTTEVYFANKNDIDLNSVTFSGGKTAVFCNAEGNTTHLAEKTVLEEAKCEVDAGKYTYCFCGQVITKETVEGTALSHDYDYVNGNGQLISLNYTDISKDGTKTVKCGLCGKEDNTIFAKRLFSYLGYSSNDKGDMCVGYDINLTEVKEYEAKYGKLDYGFVASANNDTPLDENGNEETNTVKVNLNENKYTRVDFALFSNDWTNEKVAAAKITLNMYVIVNNTVKYITQNGLNDTAEAYKYSEI